MQFINEIETVFTQIQIFRMPSTRIIMFQSISDCIRNTQDKQCHSIGLAFKIQFSETLVSIEFFDANMLSLFLAQL